MSEFVDRLRKVLRTRPRPFQMKGIKFLERAGGRALLGDDMGLGKTLQVLGYLALHEELRPAVIVCPASAKYEWEDQIRRHTRRLKCTVLSGKKSTKCAMENIVIINYDILKPWLKVLLKSRPKVVVMDECHYVKSRSAQRTLACKRLTAKAEAVIPMSGTPIVNRPSEFFSVLNMIDQETFPSFWQYAFRYCNPQMKFGVWQFEGATNLNELHSRVKKIMLRRMKSEVLTELPRKQRIPILLDLANRREYVEARDNFLRWYTAQTSIARASSLHRAEAVVRVGQLKKLAATGKLEAAYRWIDDHLQGGNKLVVFAYHRHVFNALKEHYTKIAAIGGKAGRARKVEVDRFQTDPHCRLFIASLKADREAITLTAASAVLFLEMGWTPGEHDQAEDRINRIGQKANSITAFYLLGRNSIDIHVWDLIEEKRRVLAQILDGQGDKKPKITLEELLVKINKESENGQ